ncbi:MAG: copper transporter [Actinomycetota bacterium]|nr:copper transporter [Actinomycetota bacterium]
MINFRFHLISLIAVFLALGLGIVVGSTVVDDAIVDRLERDIDEVRTESAERTRENDELRDQLATAERYTEDLAPFAVEARLAEIPVAVIAERGVDDDRVGDTVDMLRAAGAEIPGVLWLEPSWKLEDVEEVRALKEATGATGSKVAARALALDALATRLVEGPPAAGEAAESGDLIAALRSAGFLGYDGDDAALAEFSARPARALLVTGTRSELGQDGVTLATARAFAEAGVATVVGEVYEAGDENAPVQGATLAPIRTDDAVADQISTVDHLDVVAGRVAAVLALEDLGRSVVGHYGYGSDAGGPLPEPQS